MSLWSQSLDRERVILWEHVISKRPSEKSFGSVTRKTLASHREKWRWMRWKTEEYLSQGRNGTELVFQRDRENHNRLKLRSLSATIAHFPYLSFFFTTRLLISCHSLFSAFDHFSQTAWKVIPFCFLCYLSSGHPWDPIQTSHYLGSSLALTLEFCFPSLT